jgi:hypothetical protein
MSKSTAKKSNKTAVKDTIERVIIKDHFNTLHSKLKLKDFKDLGFKPIMIELLNPAVSETMPRSNEKEIDEDIARTINDKKPAIVYERTQIMKTLVISNLYFHKENGFNKLFPWLKRQYPLWFSNKKTAIIKRLVVYNFEYGINCTWKLRKFPGYDGPEGYLTFERINHTTVDTLERDMVLKYAGNLMESTCKMIPTVKTVLRCSKS